MPSSRVKTLYTKTCVHPQKWKKRAHFALTRFAVYGIITLYRREERPSFWGTFTPPYLSKNGIAGGYFPRGDPRPGLRIKEVDRTR